ncbi:M28 family peptidase [Sphingomicrobium astaxanthinifaciens]|uniref:M28 family peptidase n=1 Tax=Sphingomicrobium astaxanthinifaciens TaxID=1227949 RepID=UPI001FCC0B06|nr:M28 family peptidase [Sphingomicrobium astaxanthinifaciens]MCJ7420992.1 M28 family peptidase [Sphingomicrobium astaxanthinifaciens]
MTAYRYLLAAGMLGLAAPLAAQAPADPPRAQSDEVRAHVEFLADDLLEGRRSGTRGYDLAALYVASRYRAMGLEPGAPDGRWFQDVPFVRAAPGETVLTGYRGDEPVALGPDRAALRPSPAGEAIALDAPLVLAGRGISEPLLGVDDYAGLDVAGKIVVVLPGTVPGQAGDINAHVGSIKAEVAAAKGARGILYVLAAPAPRASRFLDYMRGNEVVDFIGPDGRPSGLPGALEFEGYVTLEAASALFGLDLAPVARAAAAGGEIAIPHAPEARLTVDHRSVHEHFTSPNVIARLPGSDPQLAGETVMMTAHLDHVGINPEARGEDKIFNGALDNAAGIATMLEAARLFTLGEAAPRRSVTFIALAAEEMGLLGAGYYAAQPTVPLDDIAAVVNLDMPVPLYDFTDVVAFGAAYNSVAEKVADAGASLGISVSPDPMPEQNIFVRSDHYEFAKKGVPAILLFTGYANGGEDEWNAFFAERYHKPGDDLSQPLDWRALARYADLNYRIARTIADEPDAPRWYEGTYFGDRFDPGGERAARPAALDSAPASH